MEVLEGGTWIFGSGLENGSWSCARAAWKAWLSSPTGANRSCGGLAVALRITRYTAGGTLGLFILAGGKGSLMCFIKTAIGVSASKGSLPVES